MREEQHAKGRDCLLLLLETGQVERKRAEILAFLAGDEEE